MRADKIQAGINFISIKVTLFEAQFHSENWEESCSSCLIVKVAYLVFNFHTHHEKGEDDFSKVVFWAQASSNVKVWNKSRKIPFLHYYFLVVNNNAKKREKLLLPGKLQLSSH